MDSWHHAEPALIEVPPYAQSQMLVKSCQATKLAHGLLLNRSDRRLNARIGWRARKACQYGLRGDALQIGSITSIWNTLPPIEIANARTASQRQISARLLVTAWKLMAGILYDFQGRWGLGRAAAT